MKEFLFVGRSLTLAEIARLEEAWVAAHVGAGVEGVGVECVCPSCHESVFVSESASLLCPGCGVLLCAVVHGEESGGGPREVSRA